MKTYEELLAENEALAAQNELLNTHFKRMQTFCGKYLAPNGRVGNDEFINQIIFLLDGPEQRAAQSDPAQCLAEIKAEAVNAFANEIGVFSDEYDDQGYVEVAKWKVQEHIAKVRQGGE